MAKPGGALYVRLHHVTCKKLQSGSGLAALRALPVASIFLALSGLAVAGHCPVLRTTAHVDWSAIAGKYWLEIATHPAIPQCTVRVYYPRRAVMMWYQTNGYGGEVTKKRQYSFLLHNDVQLLQRNGQFFQQILDTDNQSWALVHVCSTNDGISKILFTTLEPWNMIPVEIQQRITMALHTAGLPELPLIQSNCVPHRELVPYYSY
ncbi:uncharacterized protein LOC142802839 [Rhipicephalus microplus]|uniref:uncharacterized protein LOC142802839 n=1 Tax=Rhipicephalus microplus TaxID=6941 RepID=UPI003F6B95FB